LITWHKVGEGAVHELVELVPLHRVVHARAQVFEAHCIVITLQRKSRVAGQGKGSGGGGAGRLH